MMKFFKFFMWSKDGSCEEEEEGAFMACTIRVDHERKGWQKVVSKVIQSIHRIRCCRVGQDGVLEVSGFVYPKVLMKSLGKVNGRAEVVWIQFGQCSSNLVGPDRKQFQRVPPPPPPPNPPPPGGSTVPPRANVSRDAYQQGYARGPAYNYNYGADHGISPCTMM